MNRKSMGSDANNSSRLCFTFVKVTTPSVPRIPLPTKFAVAEKHIYLSHRGSEIYDFRLTVKDANAWLTGMICMVLIFTCAGRVATQ